MSRFSGKCDFYDEICICGLDFILGCDVYIGNEEKPLKLMSMLDCAPYFPHIVHLATFVGDKRVIRLSEKSWVDTIEERYGVNVKMHKYYREELMNEIKRLEEEAKKNETRNTGR